MMMGEALRLAQLEVLGAAPRCDVDDAGSLIHGHLVPRHDPVLDPEPGSRSSKGPRKRQPTMVLPGRRLGRTVVGVAVDRHPLAVGSPPVLLVGVDRRRHVGREVHGVVVQTTSDSPSRSSSGSRTNRDGSVFSW
jgi:hypothetical protein